MTTGLGRVATATAVCAVISAIAALMTFAVLQTKNRAGADTFAIALGAVTLLALLWMAAGMLRVGRAKQAGLAQVAALLALASAGLVGYAALVRLRVETLRGTGGDSISAAMEALHGLPKVELVASAIRSAAILAVLAAGTSAARRGGHQRPARHAVLAFAFIVVAAVIAAIFRGMARRTASPELVAAGAIEAVALVMAVLVLRRLAGALVGGAAPPELPRARAVR